MNILFTCAGRRNYLIHYFQQALQGSGQIIAVDADLTAPALQESDVAIQVPNVYDPQYINALLEICKTQEVGMMISLNDLELPILADHRDQFESQGVTPIISNKNVISICADKCRTADFLGKNGFDTPLTYVTLAESLDAISRKEIDFPLMVKPRWGSASIGLTKVTNVDELEWAYRLTEKIIARGSLANAGHDKDSGKSNPDSPDSRDTNRTVIIQEWMNGDEFGLDVLNDLNGQFSCVYAKQKLGMRAGETDKAILVDDARLHDLGERIGRTIGHTGNLDIDVFLSDDRVVILEMNPRFGGGYPFSHEFGARYPQALIAWAAKRSIDPAIHTRKEGVTITKCDRLMHIV